MFLRERSLLLTLSPRRMLKETDHFLGHVAMVSYSLPRFNCNKLSVRKMIKKLFGIYTGGCVLYKFKKSFFSKYQFKEELYFFMRDLALVVKVQYGIESR